MHKWPSDVQRLSEGLLQVQRSRFAEEIQAAPAPPPFLLTRDSPQPSLRKGNCNATEVVRGSNMESSHRWIGFQLNLFLLNADSCTIARLRRLNLQIHLMRVKYELNLNTGD